MLAEGKVIKLIIAITGASGAVYGVKLLEVLKHRNVETHLVMSKMDESVVMNEVDWEKDKVIALATSYYACMHFAEGCFTYFRFSPAA